MKNKKIVILSGSHLSLNPRVVKEADALTEMGYKVEVLGRGNFPDLLKQDIELLKKRKWQFKPIFANCTFLIKVFGKIQCYIGNLLFKVLKLENYWQLGPMPAALLKEGRKRNAFLYIAHSEAGMWAAVRLHKERKKIGVDMEDWFSEDLLPDARKKRPIQLLKKLERNLLCEGAYSSCTSESMADGLVKAYGCRRPLVIRNVFSKRDREGLDKKWKDRPEMYKWMEKNDLTTVRPNGAPVSIHWFSQTIGPGRGLENLFQALQGMKGNWEIHLRGNLKGYEKWLERACPKTVFKKLKVHELVENKELLSRIAEHDIGYAGELEKPPSRNLTITNKVFQYLLGGLVVVASSTAGQKEAAKKFKKSVHLFKLNSANDLKKKLSALVSKQSFQNKPQKRELIKLYLKHSWEKEKQILKRAIFNIYSNQK